MFRYLPLASYLYTYTPYVDCCLPLKSSQTLGQIRLLQVLNFLRSQRNLGSRHGLINALLAVQTQNRVLVGVLQRPGNRHLSHGDALLLGNLLDAVDDRLVGLGLAAADEKLEGAVGRLAEGGARAPGAGEDASGHGGPGDEADAGVDAVRDHFAFFFAGDQVVVVLHADEAVPAVAFGDVLEGDEFWFGEGEA